MTVSLQFSDLEVKSHLNKSDYESLTNHLKISFKLERGPDGAMLKYDFEESALITLHKILNTTTKLELSDKKHSDLITELFRALRNYCTNNETQQFITNDCRFLEDVNRLVVKVIDHQGDDLRMILQFLINLITSNPNGCSVVFEKFSPHILTLLKRGICIYESSALLYYIALNHPIDALGCKTYEIFFKIYEGDNSMEFVHFLLEKIITYSNFWDNYKSFDLKYRITSLELIRNLQIKHFDYKLSEVAIRTLAKEFSESSAVIFQTVTNISDDDSEPYEVSLLLEVLASVCSDEHSLEILQTDKNFLINAGVVLINIHRLGKSSENYFSSIQRLSEVREPNDVIKQHPAFGFKVGLVRIIGNMCWKNPSIQDLVREAELIPVILDCCNMDARNPFIMQWVILAIRNLCANNQKNQALIAELHQDGTVSSSTLEEMGLTLQSDGDNSIKIIPLDSLRK